MKELLEDLFSFFKRRIFGVKTVQFGFGVRFGKRTQFEGNNRIGHHVRVHRSFIGRGSYIGENSILNDSWIGRYTCIGQRVYVVRGQHPTEKFVSIHPAFYSTQKQAGFTFSDKDLFDEYKYADMKEKYAVKIGNDVWIGSDVKLLEGVTIHDGAVIACGAVVTKDVEPYEIVGGVPAKHLKYRFTEEQRKALIKTKWWDRNDEWMRENLLLFQNIEKFCNKDNQI